MPMNVSGEITAAAPAPATRPPIIPRRVTFDIVMKSSLQKIADTTRLVHDRSEKSERDNVTAMLNARKTSAVRYDRIVAGSLTSDMGANSDHPERASKVRCDLTS
jgi:hypothetical protein